MEDIIAAAKIAEAHDFILELPDGYDTIVGERGQKLSGGQRQCVALARLFLANHQVLFLDEPSSSMDLHTERQFINRLQGVLKICAHNVFTYLV